MLSGQPASVEWTLKAKMVEKWAKRQLIQILIGFSLCPVQPYFALVSRCLVEAELMFVLVDR
jgi:hypothetical protein